MFLFQQEEDENVQLVENSLMKFQEFEIEFTGEGISKIPETLYKKRELSNLYLSSNFLKILPKEFFQHMKFLKVIHLSYNKLTNIPKEISELKYLETLLLDHNSINKIEVNGLKNCKKLKKLDLSFNNISILPQNEFENSTFLNIIKLSNNPIESMNEKFSSVINSKELTEILKSLEFNPNEKKLEEILEHEINLDFLEEQNFHAVEIDLSEIPTIENSILMRYQKSMAKMEEEEEDETQKMILSRRRTRKPGEKPKTLKDIFDEDEKQRNLSLNSIQQEKESQKKTKKMYNLLIEIDEKLIMDLEKSDKLIVKRQEKMKFGCSLNELIEYEEKKNSFFQQCEKIDLQITKIKDLLEDLKDTAVYPPGLSVMIDDLKRNMEGVSSLESIFEDEEEVIIKMTDLNQKSTNIYEIFENKPKFRRSKQKVVAPSKSSVVVVSPTSKGSMIVGGPSKGSIAIPQKGSMIMMDKPKKIRRG